MVQRSISIEPIPAVPRVPVAEPILNFDLSDSFCLDVCMRLSGMQMIRKFLADESAATAIEYGLIAAGIALAIITAVSGVGTKLSSTFGKVSTSLK